MSRCQQKLSLQYVQSLRGADARAAELGEVNKELSARIGELESAARSNGVKNRELVRDLELKITHLQQSFTRQAFARQSEARQCQQLANQVFMLETMIKQRFGVMHALHQIEANKRPQKQQQQMQDNRHRRQFVFDNNKEAQHRRPAAAPTDVPYSGSGERSNSSNSSITLPPSNVEPYESWDEEMNAEKNHGQPQQQQQGMQKFMNLIRF